MDKINELGVKISTFRKAMGLSQKELAERLFVSTSTVSKWENGKASPDIQRIREIAKVFQVSVSEFIGETESFAEDISECIIAKTVDKNDKDIFQRKILKYFIVIFLLIVAIGVAVWKFNNKQTFTDNSLNFKIVDEFLDESSHHWGYDSIYHVVVEFEGELNSDAQLTFGEYLRKKYKKHLESVSVINVVFFEEYNERSEVFNAGYYVYILPKEK